MRAENGAAPVVRSGAARGGNGTRRVCAGTVAVRKIEMAPDRGCCGRSGPLRNANERRVRLNYTGSGVGVA
jgi:hypothetical protein